eukprot:1300616-Pyramimonas_sp.AAC.1
MQTATRSPPARPGLEQGSASSRGESSREKLFERPPFDPAQRDLFGRGRPGIGASRQGRGGAVGQEKRNKTGVNKLMRAKAGPGTLRGPAYSLRCPLAHRGTARGGHLLVHVILEALGRGLERAGSRRGLP